MTLCGKDCARPRVEFPGKHFQSRLIEARQLVGFHAVGGENAAGIYTEASFSMRRALALAVLLTFAAGPVTRVVCGWTCAHVGEAVPSEECHEENGAEPAFNIGVDHCEGSGLPVALTAKVGDGLTAPSPGLSSVQPAPASQLDMWTAVPTGDSATAPSTNRLIPLRI